MATPSRYVPHPDVPGQLSDSDLASAKDDILDALYAGVRRVHRNIPSRDSVFIGSSGELCPPGVVHHSERLRLELKGYS